MGGIDIGFVGIGWLTVYDTIGEVVEITKGWGLLM